MSIADGSKTWIELTRRKEHMSKPGNLLDKKLLEAALFSLEDLTIGA